ncbi:immunoglobulin domain-containing protein [Streptomyces aureoverticillatus]|uniref:immunoglobulin domain-containing protein n=1 Tax=Streptomyces aureoverticillatus TaxID=66871 RepID=UPI001EF96EE3|nr:immunoglobulin domain-containing protein [Streptomyces aureoverticillatus]
MPLLTASALTLATLTTGFAPGDANAPEEKDSYRRAGDFTTAGKPLDVLIHPDSKKLYVGSDDDAGTADVNEMGLYVLDRADGAVRGWTSKAPGSTGVPRESAVHRIAGPLPGDGVVFHYPLKGLGTAKDGDTEAKGVWLTGAKVTDVGPGVTEGTTLVAQGTALTEVETATGKVERSLALPGAGRFAVDAERRAVWWADLAQNKLYRVDTASFTVAKTVELPVTQGAEGSGGFTAVDPATGSVWVGRQDEVMVFGPDGAPRGTVKDTDLARDVAFDGARAYIARQDVGDPGAPGYDGRGSLTVVDTITLKDVAEPLPLPGNEAQLGSAAVTVAPGGAEVFVTSPAQGRVTRIERNTPPEITESPEDLTVTAGSDVTFTAKAKGSPEPAVRWQESTDGGESWRPVEGATDPSYTFKSLVSHDGYRYRAEFTNDAGTARTEPVTLTVRAEPGDGGPGGPGTGDGGTGGDPGDGSDEGSSDGGDNGDAAEGGSAGGDSGDGASGAAGGSDGGAGSDGSAGSVGGGAGSDGSLASTGQTVTGAAALAAALTAAGWYAVRRARRSATVPGLNSRTP